LGELNRTEIDLKSQLETVLRRLEELATKKAKIPEMKVEFEHLNNLIQKAEKELCEKKGLNDKKEKEQRELGSAITNLKRITWEINSGLYPQISKDENQEIRELVQKLVASEDFLSNEEATLKSLNTTIKQQETLNQTISDFIKAGLIIVSEHQSSACPLCEQVYGSYNALVEKITNNKALDDTLKTLLDQKSKSELRISELITNVKQSREQLLNIYIQQIDRLSTKNQEVKEFLDSLRRNIKDIEVELNILKEKREIQKLDLNGLSFEIFEMQIDENIIEAIKVRDILNPKLFNNKKAIDTTTEKFVSLKKQIDLIKNENESLIKNEKYLSVTSWFIEYFPDKEVNKELLLQRDFSLAKSIGQLDINLKEIGNKNITLFEELTSFKKENLLEEKLKLEKLTYENDLKLTAYSYFLKDNLNVNLSQIMDETMLLSIINDKQKKYKAELEHTRSIQFEYQKLERFCDNVWPFLQSENAKIKLAKAKEEIIFLEQKIKPILELERDNAKLYLQERIKSFFHEKLIDKLYRKIDPHPDFKSVKFKANFDSDNPRLDVFVENENNETVLIPNLYFSTAQINILSLSIFLASALNSKEYNCIFIDDPIQSMDSVNVLSTIDLFRSLMFNEGKQIILSTHDENFHNLLKMKMPPKLFDSKFLELEALGKLKPN
jgi:exonuclease SbcC